MTRSISEQSEQIFEITSERPLLDLRLGEAARYGDLLWLLVRRDFVSTFKQTVLGPAWILLQPLLTTLIFTLIFGNIAGLPTEGDSKLLFYLAGVTCWSLFATILTRTSATFLENASVFGKVYFPRVVAPFAVVVSSIVRFSVQFALFIVVLAVSIWQGSARIPGVAVLWLPVLVLMLSAIALGLGLTISALTAKYRDLQLLLNFGVQLLMYASPVIYPIAAMPEHLQTLLLLNPVGPIIEAFRTVFLNSGSLSLGWLLYSLAFAAVSILLGTIAYNRAELRFMDTI